MNNISAQPARPGRQKSDAKRRAILDAAGTRFLRDGYDKTSMDGVAGAAGVSKQTVYSHFSSKEDLFRACIEDKVTEYGLDLDTLPIDLPLRDALNVVGNQFLELLADDKVIAMHRLLAAECGEHPRLVETFFAAGPRATMAKLVGYLQRHRGPGAIEVDDPETVGSTFFALMKGMYFTMRLLDLRPPMEEDERQRHVAGMVDAFMKIYAPVAVGRGFQGNVYR